MKIILYIAGLRAKLILFELCKHLCSCSSSLQYHGLRQLALPPTMVIAVVQFDHKAQQDIKRMTLRRTARALARALYD